MTCRVMLDQMHAPATGGGVETLGVTGAGASRSIDGLPSFASLGCGSCVDRTSPLCLPVRDANTRRLSRTESEKECAVWLCGERYKDMFMLYVAIYCPPQISQHKYILLLASCGIGNTRL